MTGELTAPGLIDFRKAVCKAIPTATITFPGGNTRRYSLEGSPLQGSLGIYRDRMRDIGDIDYRLSDPRGGLQSVATTLRIADQDGDVRAIVSRYGMAAMRGSSVAIDDSTTSPVADWPRLMTGVIDAIEPVSGFEWAINARVDDRPLVDGTFKVPRLNSAHYLSAVQPNLEKLLQVPLGLFDSRDGTVAGSTGSVELIRLNEADGTGGFTIRYLLASPYATYVSRVMVGGSPLASSAWVRTYTLRGGVSTSEVWLASDPGATAVVTADIQGVGEDVSGSSIYLGASGTGAPIVNIVRQIRWVLRNYVWSAYRTGAFAADPSSIDATTWDAAETWAEQRRFRGSVLLKDAAQRPIDLFNAFCQWAWVSAGWNRQGKLILKPLADDDAPYYSDTRWIRYALKGSESAFLPSLPRDKTVHQIKSASWLVPASNANRSIVSVRDSRITGNVVTEINYPLGVARQEFQPNFPGTPGSGGIVLSLDADRPGPQGDAVYLFNGGSLVKWRDLNWSPANNSTDFPNSFRTEKSLTDPGNPPKWFAGGLNGHAFVRFDGVNDYLIGTSTGTFSTTDLTLEVVFRIAGASAKNAGSPHNQDPIICEGNGNWGLYVYADAGNFFVQGDAFNGTHHLATAQISLNTWYVARLRLFGGTLYLSINNWDEVSVGSAGISSFGVALKMGADQSVTRFLNGDIAALMMFNVGDIAAQGNTSGNTTPGLGAAFDIWKSLMDRYRL